jgi:hypothetical protein
MNTRHYNTIQMDNVDLLQQKSVDFGKYEEPTDQDLKYLSKSKMLRILWIDDGNKITDKGISHLSHIKTLEHIHIGSCSELTDQSLEFLSKMKSLIHLTCSFRIEHVITDKGLEYLSKSKTLKELNFYCFPKIISKGFNYLSKSKTLISLNVMTYDKTSNVKGFEIVSRNILETRCRSERNLRCKKIIKACIKRKFFS